MVSESIYINWAIWLICMRPYIAARLTLILCVIHIIYIMRHLRLFLCSHWQGLGFLFLRATLFILFSATLWVSSGARTSICLYITLTFIKCQSDSLSCLKKSSSDSLNGRNKFISRRLSTSSNRAFSISVLKHIGSP